MIDDLLTVLNAAGLTPTSDELRDALWLAGELAVRPTEQDRIAALVISPMAEPHVRKEPVTPTTTENNKTDDPTVVLQMHGQLYAVGGFGLGGSTERVRGTPVRTIAVRRPCGQIELARAMRPLGLRVPARTELLLDEPATVSRIAEEGIWDPVLRPGTERWLSLSIVIDDSPTMAIWADQVERFRTLVERLGLFRLVRVHGIDDRLTPRHRQAVLLVTDGVSEMWHDGRMRDLLERWGAAAPVAVCEMLPPRMWRGTGIRVERTQVRAAVAGAPNRSWTIRTGTSSATPIPVVRLSPRWLGSWADVVSGTSRWTTMALLTHASEGSDEAPDHTLGPGDIVTHFRLGASPNAFRLACLLSAAWLTLPVMRMVRNLMLPEADDACLSEVFLGGVLTRSGPPSIDAEKEIYDFLPGVRAHLTHHLHRDDLLNVVRETTTFIAARYGTSFDVAALLADPEHADSPTANGHYTPHYVAANVLAQLGGRYSALIDSPPKPPPVATEVDAPTEQLPIYEADAPTERLPIYEAVLSQWFEAADTGSPVKIDEPLGSSFRRTLSNRYELDRELAHGNTSEVHLGRDIRLGRNVVVKLMRSDVAHDPQFQERFRREAKVLATLNHPTIVTAYDTGQTGAEHGSLPYIVMEYVDGRTLRDIVKIEGPLHHKRALETMADVCVALDFSHRHGIVHQNVKPANVMISRTGAVKLTGYDIAQINADENVTHTRAIVGTAMYMSPEQARGEQVDARSDVYSAGCTLFELLTGSPPFQGESPVSVAYQHIREEPRPPSTLNPSMTPALDAVVLKTMEKNPSNRYQTAAEMRIDLIRILTGQRPRAQALPW